MRLWKVETVKDHNQEQFNWAVNDVILQSEKKGYTCTVQFAPLMLPAGKVLYLAMISMSK